MRRTSHFRRPRTIDNGEIDSAQRHYDKAADSFAKADDILS